MKSIFIILTALLLTPLAALRAAENVPPIVGAIRWDAWYGESGPVKHTEASLGPPKYHYRLPWFARVVGEGKVSINGDSQAILEKEIAYAAAAGLNYWAFVDYWDDANLSIALRRYRAAKDKQGVRYCFVEEGGRLDAIGTRGWTRLVEHFKDPNYQTVLDGRPLLFLFVKSKRLGRTEWRELGDAAVSAGLARPYLVLMGWQPESDAKDMAAIGFDAVSAYARGGRYSMEQPTYAEQCALIRRDRWEKCREHRIPSVTFASAGWDTRPRNERPPPWITGIVAKPDHTPPSRQKPLMDAVTATPDELAAHIREALEWTQRNRDINPSNAIIIYGWNENDEGGWLIPTLGSDGRPNEERIEALSKVLRGSSSLAPAPHSSAKLASPTSAAGEGLQKPPQVWADYDPDQGDFKQEIVKEESKDGMVYRESYISAYVQGEEIRVYCQYRVRDGATNAPGLLNVHGWMGAPSIDNSYVEDGWAVMTYDYCGNNGKRTHYTRYPAKLSHCNMDRAFGTTIRSTTPDKKSITDPKQTSDYVWYAIERRVLSYLEQQKEVDKTRLGAKGYSYGGTLMWPLATDPRIKAVVAFFGIGWTDYYRDKQVWMYNKPYVEPEKSPGERIFLAGIAPEAYVPYITAPTLFLSGSNDHHGGHERGLESFKMFSPGVPWSFAIQARGHHNTDKIGQDCKMWLEKHVLSKEVFWPEHPQSEIKLNPEGIPQLMVTPASSERVRKVEMFYALKSPCSFARSWRDVACIRNGDTWVGTMPVLNVDDYVFGYANINYDTAVVLSTDFNAAIPSKLGNAKATDKPSNVISTANEGMSAWTDVAEVEGPGGIKGFRSTNNRKGSGTEQLSDPKWQAPPNGQLGFTFYCTEPQTLILTAGDHHSGEIEITALDEWQEMVVNANNLTNRHNRQAMQDWSKVGKIHFTPKQGSDITKVVFAEFRWVGSVKEDARE